MKQQLSAATMRSLRAMQVLSMFSGMPGGLSSRDILVPSRCSALTAGVKAGTPASAPAGVAALDVPRFPAPELLLPMGEVSPLTAANSAASGPLVGRRPPPSLSKAASVVVVSTSMSSARSRYSFNS